MPATGWLDRNTGVHHDRVAEQTLMNSNRLIGDVGRSRESCTESPVRGMPAALTERERVASILRVADFDARPRDRRHS